LFVCLPRAAQAFATPVFDAWVARNDTRAAIDTLRAAPTVDWPAVNALKRQGFERLWVDLRSTADTALTREAAVKALGKAAGQYEIRSLEKTASR
jgi:hypothetical protein